MRKNAFTLIELLSVIVIFVITFLIVVPSMNSLIGNSERKEIELIEQRVLSAAKEYVNNFDGSFYKNFYNEGDTGYVYKSDLINAGLIEENEISKLDTFAGVKGELLSNDRIRYTVEYITASNNEYTNEELYLMIKNLQNDNSSSENGNVNSDAIENLQNQINKNSTDISNVLSKTNNNETLLANLTNKEYSNNVFLQNYPVGSIYISITNTNPKTLFGGTWEQVSKGRALFGAGELNGITYTSNTNIDAGLPNITGSISAHIWTDSDITATGAFTLTTGTQSRPVNGSTQYYKGILFDASKSNSIYGKSETVQPNAYVVYMWKRTA